MVVKEYGWQNLILKGNVRSVVQQMWFKILLILILVPFVYANNLTNYEAQTKTFTSTLNLYISNSTVGVEVENTSTSYPNIGGFNYSFDFNIERTVNVSLFTFNTIDIEGNLTCPKPSCPGYNLSCPQCPSLSVDPSNITSGIRDWLYTNVRPSEVRINELESELDICRTEAVQQQSNYTSKMSQFGRYQADANHFEELFEQEKRSNMIYIYLIVGLGTTMLVLFALQVTGGNVTHLWRKKPY